MDFTSHSQYAATSYLIGFNHLVSVMETQQYSLSRSFVHLVARCGYTSTLLYQSSLFISIL